MKITVVGCGEAFGSGGRATTCFWIETEGYRFLLDCGASSLPRMRALGLDPMDLDAALITHLHWDHFGGLAVLDRYFHVYKKPKPWVIVGPPHLERAFKLSLEAAFPGSEERAYELSLRPYENVGPLKITAYPMVHDPLTYPHGLKVEAEGKVVAFTGDTAWNEAIVDLADGADLFLCECQTTGTAKGDHLDLPRLRRERARLKTPRIALTHMGNDLLEALPLPDFEALSDGLVLEV